MIERGKRIFFCVVFFCFDLFLVLWFFARFFVCYLVLDV